MGILLGTSDAYTQNTKAIFRWLYEDFMEINPVAFIVGGILWIYAAHPSPANGHFRSWGNGTRKNSSSKKKLLAIAGMRQFFKENKILAD